MAFLRSEIAFVKSVGNQLDGSLCHALELLLHQRRDRNHDARIVKYLLLHLLVPALSATDHGKVLEIEDLSPRITEICDPRQAGLPRQSVSDQMHGLWRTRADDKVNRMLLQVFFQITYRGADPHAAGVRAKEIATHPHRNFLQKTFVLSIHRIHLHCLLAVARLAENLLIDFVRLSNRGLYHLRLRRYLCFQRSVHGQLFRVLRSVNYRLPTFGRKVFGKLYPTLHARSAGRRPIIRYDEHPFHKRTKINKIADTMRFCFRNKNA